MQCYEYQVMLAHVYDAIASMEPGYRFDELALGEILDDLGVDNLQQLLRLSNKQIWLQSLPAITDCRQAA